MLFHVNHSNLFVILQWSKGSTPPQVRPPPKWKSITAPDQRLVSPSFVGQSKSANTRSSTEVRSQVQCWAHWRVADYCGSYSQSSHRDMMVGPIDYRHLYFVKESEWSQTYSVSLLLIKRKVVNLLNIAM